MGNNFVLFGLIVIVSCVPSMEGVPFYCEASHQCPSNMYCNLSKKRCEKGVEQTDIEETIEDAPFESIMSENLDKMEHLDKEVASCLSPQNCDDNNPCTDDTCVNGKCIYTFNTHQCAPPTCVKKDGKFYYISSSFCVGGKCLASEHILCEDQNPCTEDLCDPSKGCYTVNNLNPCDDGNKCTVMDYCKDGICIGGNIVECDDKNICTVDQCDPQIGCVFTPISGSCDDDNICTEDDQCIEGKCVGQNKNCDDGNICTTDICEPMLGCVYVFNDVACDDNDQCTKGDRCQYGKCLGESIYCDDQNFCTEDTCISDLGCVFINKQDQTPCGKNAVCLGGKCESLCWKEPCPIGFQTFDGCHCKVQPTGVTLCTDGKMLVSCDQIKVGSNLYGQDGHFPSGALSFQVNINGNNTVTDLNTGLIWARFQSPSLKWDNAKDYCELNAQGLVGGQWRIPHILEAIGIIDYSKTECPMWSSFFEQGVCPNHWAQGKTPFWVIYYDGTTKPADPNGETNVRCVRSIKMFGEGMFRFLKTSDTEVYDKVTGLTWMRYPSQALSWSGALNYCLEKGGRVPNIKEIASLLVFNEKNCLWDSVFGQSCPQGEKFWSSTPTTSGKDAYVISFVTGEISESSIANARPVRCIINKVMKTEI